MTNWQLRPGGLYIPPDATDGPYLVQKDGNRFSQWLRLVDGDNTTVTTDDAAGTVQVDSTGSGGSGAGTPHIDTDTATTGANLVITLTDTPAAPEAVQGVFWRGVALDPTQYSYVGTALTVLDQDWTTGDLVWAAYWSEVPTVVTDPTTMLGDILVRGPSGLTRLPVGTDGYVLTADAAATNGLDWEPATGGGGGGTIWDQVLSLPLSTLTGWTAGTGTWAISSGVIRQSSTGAASNRLRYTASKIAGAGLVAEADFKVDVATSTSLSRTGFLFDYPPGSDTTGALLVALKQGTAGFIDRVYAEYEGVAAGPEILLAAPIALGTWITMRCEKIGNDVNVWVNGSLVGTVTIAIGRSDASTIALYTFDCDSSFRNLDVWVLSDDTTGGGGGSSSRDFLTPALADLNPVYGDHFIGTGLDPKWNRVTYIAGDEQYQKGDSTWLQVDVGRGAGAYYWQTAPSGDFTVVMALTMTQPTNVMFGPLILDSSGNGVQACVYSSADGYYVMGCSAVAYNSTNQTVNIPVYAAVNAGQKHWLKLSKVGTGYRASMSLDGATWRKVTASLTFATTPTRIGFGSILGTMSQFAIDFFDVQ